MLKKGKRTKEWDSARKKLKIEYAEKGITTCELMFHNCTHNNYLSFAHRYKRNDPRCEHTFQQTLLACIPCHQIIEYDRELTQQMFLKLRPEIGT